MSSQTKSDKVDTGELARFERLVRIEAKLDALTESLERRLTQVETASCDHEKRLVRIERVVWLLTILAVVVAVPTLTALIAELVQRLF